jgi:hypothetical protein
VFFLGSSDCVGNTRGHQPFCGLSHFPVSF